MEYKQVVGIVICAVYVAHFGLGSATENDKPNLRWVSCAQSSDETLHININIKCRKARTRTPTDTKFVKLCGLIKEGIARYWSRSIVSEAGTPLNVVVTGQDADSSEPGVKIDIQTYDKEPLLGFTTRSHNSGILTMTMKYLEYLTLSDENFKETAAHEIGHSFLHAAKGLGYSWRHKGSTTIWQTEYSGTTNYPKSGEIDLMKYYRDSPGPDYYNQLIAAEEDVTLLIGLCSSLEWVSSVVKPAECDHQVDIFLNIGCTLAWTKQPSDAELSRLCGLIKEGIHQYWSRQITRDDGTTLDVMVRAHDVNSSLPRKEIDIKTYKEEPFLSFLARSHNSGILGATMKYLEYRSDNDDLFKETAAHIVGLSILRAAEGTSTLWQATHAKTEGFPSSGEIDLMKYYAGAHLPADFYSRVKAAEEDVKLLMGLVHITRTEPC